MAPPTALALSVPSESRARHQRRGAGSSPRVPRVDATELRGDSAIAAVILAGRRRARAASRAQTQGRCAWARSRASVRASTRERARGTARTARAAPEELAECRRMPCEDLTHSPTARHARCGGASLPPPRRARRRRPWPRARARRGARAAPPRRPSEVWQRRGSLAPVPSPSPPPNPTPHATTTPPSPPLFPLPRSPSRPGARSRRVAQVKTHPRAAL